MVVLFALGSALGYGVGDFFGGVASRRASAIAVAFLSVAIPLPFVVVGALLLPAHAPALRDIAWGVAAGVSGGIAFGLYFRALALGIMSIAAPLMAVLATVFPVVVGIALGEKPSVRAVVGILTGLAALVLLSTRKHVQLGGTLARMHGSALALTVAGGLTTGGFLVCLAQADHRTGLWPLAVSRTATTVTLFAAATLRGGAVGVPRPVVPQVLISAAANTLAGCFFILAAQRGLLSIVAPISSLNPGVIVLLAAVVFGETIGLVHAVGLLAAAVAVVLIAGG